jgi:hypothetical protein
MELKTAIEILEYYQEWRLGKRDDMIHEAKKLTEALDMVLLEVKKINLGMEEEVLKELIIEMELRVVAFEKNAESLGTEMYHYWNGRRSEAAFMVEKLTWILENGGL